MYLLCVEPLPSGRGNALTLRVCCLLGVVRVTRPLGSTCTVSDRDGPASSFTCRKDTKHAQHHSFSDANPFGREAETFALHFASVSV